MISESHPSTLDTLPGVYSLKTPSDIDVIIASGSDATKFLQGQLSCNLQNLAPGRTLRGALCNLKGRVIADVRLLASDAGIVMQTSAGMGQVIIDTLKKYQVFFKVDLQLVSERFALLEVAADRSRLPAGALPLELPDELDASAYLEGVHITRLPDLKVSLAGHNTYGYARFECLIDTSRLQPEIITAMLGAWLEPVDGDWWRLADIASGIAHVRPGQQEQFTPQLLNYDINGTIDFKKGCYTGQEVVARMYYRAEAKRRLYRGSLPEDQTLEQNGSKEQDLVAQYRHPDGARDVLVVAETDDTKRPAWLTAPETALTESPATDNPVSPPQS